MTKRDVFGFDISVSAANEKNPKRRTKMSGETETSTRTCDYAGCNKAGKFRAPMAPNRPDDFYWFCQTHAREYNKNWNFFESISETEFQEQTSSDRVWERPTKPLNDSEKKAWSRLGIEDPYQILGNNATRNPGYEITGRKLPSTEVRALEILDCKETQRKSEIRNVYKELIKVLHPDNNSGDRSQEDQLQEVVWAWDQIKNSRNFRN
ncbi:MAG: J domain-containing protein [Aestuariivita sp.]|nr:J domain-containing protein [Aestuariivita sp.]